MAYLRFLKPLLISTTVIAVLEVCFAALASALLLWSMTLLDPPANLPLQFPTRAAAVVFAIASLRPVVLTAAQWIVYKKTLDERQLLHSIGQLGATVGENIPASVVTDRLSSASAAA